MFVKFDEIPAMILQDIKATKRYGRADARTDNMKTVYPPQTKFAGSIISFLISQRNHMVWVIKRTAPLRRSFGTAKTHV